MNTDTKVAIGVGIVSIAILAGIIAFGSSTVPNNTEAKKVEKGELIRPASHITGPEDAKVTIVEFADFQCPACGATHPVLKQLLSEYATQIRLVHRHFPLSTHPFAELTARASEAAAIQGKFWEMHSKMFEEQNEWSTSPNAEGNMVDYAKSLELDVDKFKQDLKSQSVTDIIAQDKGDGEALSVSSTPTIYINGEKFGGSATYDGLKSAIDTVLSQSTN